MSRRFDRGKSHQGVQAFCVVSHQRELENFAEIIRRGLIEPPNLWIVGHIGSSPIRRPAHLPGFTEFEVFGLPSPLLGDIIDPWSSQQVDRWLNRFARRNGGIQLFFSSGQYGWRGLFLCAFGRYAGARVIFVPEGIGVLANDTYRHLDAKPALRAYIGNLNDQVKAGVELRGILCSGLKLASKFPKLLFRRGLHTSTSLPTCNVAYSLWGHVDLPNMTAESVIPLKQIKPNPEEARMKRDGCLVVHSPVPQPDKFWPEVVAAIAERGVKDVYLAPHPDITGFADLWRAAATTPGLKMHLVRTGGQLETHLAETKYNLVVGVASTVLVFLASNFPSDQVYALCGFGRQGKNSMAHLHSQFYGEVLPRVPGAVIPEF